MDITRRGFTAGALSAGALLQLPSRAVAQPAAFAGAVAAISAYAEAHRRHFVLPGLTMALSMPGGFSRVLHFGHANADARTAIGPDTLFQIGSISKCFVAALLHQYAAEDRFRLSDRLSDHLPGIPLPAGNAVTVQHLLDHVAGLPGDAPLFPEGGLWTAYRPGEHWHYSNTAYDMLGKLAEHFGGRPLARLYAERIFAPLGMRRTRGAIVGGDRTGYAQGYEAADWTVPFVRGVPLAPAAWVDVTFGAGSVASTSEDMIHFLRTLANAVQGRGGMGLGPQQARLYATHAVPTGTPGMSYGNGLMHTSNEGRSYLHHTGGMVSFSSAFHLDKASGAGAFASSTISAFAEYRPRLLTRFAVDALTNAASGRPLPVPPPLATPLSNPAQFHGTFSGPAGSFTVRAGNPLTIVASGEAALHAAGPDLFRTTHPRFRQFVLRFERTNGVVTGASWGPDSFVRSGSRVALSASDPQLARLAGRFVNDSPWWGALFVVERGGKLWLGTETPLTRIGDNLWRVGEQAWSPERLSFANFLDGRPHTMILSGEKFLRHDV